MKQNPVEATANPESDAGVAYPPAVGGGTEVVDPQLWDLLVPTLRTATGFRACSPVKLWSYTWNSVRVSGFFNRCARPARCSKSRRGVKHGPSYVDVARARWEPEFNLPRWDGSLLGTLRRSSWVGGLSEKV